MSADKLGRTAKQSIVQTYLGLHEAEPKLGEHWLWCVIQRIAARDGSAEQILADYGFAPTNFAAGAAAAGVIPAGWISVEDRMPAQETDVLVRTVGGRLAFDIAGFFHGAWASAITEREIDGEVTHWMPLPAPPSPSGAQAEQRPKGIDHDDDAAAIIARQYPAQQPQEALQDWRGISGAEAYHLIQRKADNWKEAGQMMEAWAASRAPDAGLTDEQIEEIWQSLWGNSYSTEIRRRKFARAILKAAGGEG